MKTRKKLAVLLLATIGVLRSTIAAMRGYKISSMVTRAPASLSTTSALFALFGLLNNLAIQQFDSYKTHITRIKEINE